ncbi:hypothetical protein P4S80_05015 [Aeribacillus composti]|uniref:hypothetical protein n=1 Tax=Aeribacillus composti TaxID=1868734 RepID=UPI002E200A60|nr:hypothetical protein [Aeribacillus composti]MED0745269.1 hypothetical protein [Aeribacillus composti]
MFKKIKALFTISNAIKSKEQYLKELEAKIENKEQLIAEVISEAKASVQAEANEIISLAKVDATKILEDSNRELNELTNTKEQMENTITQLEEKLSALTNEVTKLGKNAQKYKVQC